MAKSLVSRKSSSLPAVSRKRGLISKAAGYLARIYTVEYDLQGMVNAYGASFLHWLIDEIVAGRIDCRQCVDRWAADKHLQLSFDQVKHTYQGDDMSYCLPESEASGQSYIQSEEEAA